MSKTVNTEPTVIPGAGAEILNAPRLAQARLTAHFAKGAGQVGPDISWRGGEALVAAGRLDPADLQRIAEHHRRTKQSYGMAASKLKLLNKEDLLTALAIDRGYIDPSAAAARIPKELVFLRDPKSAMAEQYRALRTRLLTMRDAQKLNLFAMVGLGGQAHTVVAAANLATAFAQIGLRVALIDADPNGDRLRRLFSLSADGPTLLSVVSEYDVERETTLRVSFVNNLSLLPSGRASAASPDFLASGHLKRVLHDVAETQDIVMVLSAPFGALSDGRHVWAAAERALVMVRRHQDRLHQLKALQGALRQVGAETLGALMTQ